MNVVTRFAPSPTGYVHVGSQRTALYNYIFARQQKGKFILRIEDTDQNRYVEGAVENLLSSLEQLGIEFDAGPGKEDGKGPYFQSERNEIYSREVKKLMDDGKAYRCFCSEKRLDTLRKEQMEEQIPTGYDGKCRSIKREVSDERAKTEKFVIRLKTPREGICEFEDIVRGEVKIAWFQIDDQVLVKSDGFPTYHLANVVDDHYMEVTHVIRGEEWLPSVPKHLFLYECFGWDAPQMAHLPLLLNPDRSKLSKRQGDVAVEDYLKKGYTPEALNNFLALMGWNPGGKSEIYTMDELIKAFDINKITKAGAVFDVQKLDWMNGQYIKNMEVERYLNEARKWLGDLEVNEDKLDTALMAVKTSLTTFKEIPSKIAVFTGDPVEPDLEGTEMLEFESTKEVFEAYVEKITALDELKSDDFKNIMKEIQTEMGVKGKYLWMPIRVGLTGAVHGPELGYIVEYLGKEENIKRINHWIN
ncbi:MAG: glutamate--tRNA ligase [Candidatus Marinimicrobia bacterium]|nr:glutamate--tRNA ligase [Candidatus Neomarinimicrobiota bacterium]